MKTKLILAMIPLMAACVGTSMPPQETLPSGEKARITVRAELPGRTKAGFDDAAIKNVAVWIYADAARFDSGQAESFAFGSGPAIQLDCSSGRKWVFVLVNLPEHLIHRDDLLDAANLAPDWRNGWLNLSDMAESGVLMRGQAKNVQVVDGSSLGVNVTRSIAKVSVEKISLQMQDAGYTGQSLTLHGMYLINGVARVPLKAAAAQTTVSDYYNCSARYSPTVGPYPDFGQQEAPSLAADDTGLTLADRTSRSLTTVLYTGPNPATSEVSWNREQLSGSATWEPRRTRLVLECSIGGRRCYYPVTLPVLQENNWYRIREIILKHFGTDSPDVPLRFETVTVIGTRRDWDGTDIDEII